MKVTLPLVRLRWLSVLGVRSKLIALEPNSETRFDLAPEDVLSVFYIGVLAAGEDSGEFCFELFFKVRSWLRMTRLVRR